MKRSALALALLALAAAPAAAGLKDARDAVRRGDAVAAVAEYSRVRLTKNPETAAEYAYALSLAGFKDLALGHLDQALALRGPSGASSGALNFFASQVYLRAGQADVAQELALQGARPAWLPEPSAAAPAAAPSAPRSSDFQSDFAVANGLMLQRRYYTAVDRLQKLATEFPNDPDVYAGYGIALEKIGAYRKAARAVARSLELQGEGLPAERRAVFAAHKQDLESRPQEPPSAERAAVRVNRSLKGRYLAFLGGNLNRSPRSTVSNVNARVGKFFTNRVDASVTAGYTGGNIPKKYRGASFGVAGRYNQPLPVPAPLNATFGSRVEYQPRPSQKTSVTLSPGLSWVQEAGSFDLFYEYGLSGRLKKTSMVSVGYTVYFGNSK